MPASLQAYNRRGSLPIASLREQQPSPIESSAASSLCLLNDPAKLGHAVEGDLYEVGQQLGAAMKLVVH
eukprot:CAMPEP_0179061258 /NCGR_PEP_ID=MMETSP0796-20121207/26300_1 /TAXON_ID=73915 /ORGANISM="Pyrodinium bahamense, Strain pbaha01" /LENGTH=68 /DNA_ID=CAMNT_0020758089 /DNA_START=214 /DNA_END=421 /DNA_ORIENTATION=+